MPSAEILGADAFDSGLFLKPIVHVGGVDWVGILSIAVLKEALAGEFLHAGNDFGEGGVVDIELSVFPTFCAVVEMDVVALGFGMFFPESGEASGAVFLVVVLVADSSGGAIEELYDGSEDAISGEAVAFQGVVHGSTKFRKSQAKF